MGAKAFVARMSQSAAKSREQIFLFFGETKAFFASLLQGAVDSREQLFLIFRNLKWMILLSAMISVVLYLPDQVRELYRIAAADGGWIAAKEFIAIAVIALALRFGAFQLAAATSEEIGDATIASRHVLRLLPIVLGLLPIIAAIAGQLASRPDLKVPADVDIATLRQVGSVFRIQEQMLNGDKLILWVCFGVLLIIALAFIVLTWRFAERSRAISSALNTTYFTQPRYLLLTCCLIALVTAALVAVPDRPAQFLGSFGIVALFTICAVMFSLQLSLLTIKHAIPYFPIMIVVAALIALFNVNDNHYIRTLTATPDEAAQARVSAIDAFAEWLVQPARYTQVASAKEYPVFVVSAEGGGIYAAYNAATFLARMEDLCPEFREHLFAISSVSGGSVGAAVFAAALHSADQSQSIRAHSRLLARTAPASCTKISQFLSRASKVANLSTPDATEQYVQGVLADDFLSPLISASLFPDFLQAFIPYPIGTFDRARALEYTLEDAVDRVQAKPKAADKPNLMKADYQSLWTPANGMPALLLNTTDSGSGKRVLISPFDIYSDNPVNSDICMFANITRGAQASESRSPHFPLSTAAFMSARFPWVSPAATVSINNSCITENTTARLVDGGYIDNSGVQTALDMIDALKSVLSIDAFRNVKIYHIAIAGGTFPDHGAFSFGDLMEPIRALLSTRTSRGYIALNLAEWRASHPGLTPASTTPAFDVSPFNRINLKNYFYDLPLGWELSNNTRDIIALNSGRFWDCHPDPNLAQSVTYLSAADCVQLQVYHLLNGSAANAIMEQANIDMENRHLESVIPQLKPSKNERAEHERLLECYEKNWIQKPSEKGPSTPPKPYLATFQSDQVRALLSEWERQSGTEQRELAYLLGSISYDSQDFARTTDNLWFSSAGQLPSSWRKRLGVANVPVESVLKNPEALANAVWGPDFGNTNPGDGWNFRTRGIYEKVGRQQYNWANKTLAEQYPDLKLDILADPDALWNEDISAKVAITHFFHFDYGDKTLTQMLKDTTQSWKSIREKQVDEDHNLSDQDNVAERSDMFLDCIHEVGGTSRFRNLEASIETPVVAIARWVIGTH